MGGRERATDLVMKVANRAHRGVVVLSGGRLGTRMGTAPIVQLHTTGRTSGARRTVMLSCPGYREDRVLLVASKGGDDRDPDWFRNLVANPDVELTEDAGRGRTRQMRARVASPQERAELWPRITADYPNYAGYEKKTTRVIPVVVLEPR